MRSIIISFIIISLSILTINAQEIKIKEKKVGGNGLPTFVLFDSTGELYTKGEEKKVLKKFLKTTSTDKFEKLKSHTDKQGIEHQVFQQYYNNVKVDNSTYRVHIKNGKVESINGNFVKIIGLNTASSIEPEEAIQKALDKVKAQKYAWESVGMEKIIKEEKNDLTATYYPEAELVIWHAYRKDKAHLAYKIEVFSLEPYNHEYVYVDAHNGIILDRDPIAKNSATTGTAATRYSNSRNLTTDSFTSGFRLRDPSRGNGIETYDMNEGTDFSNAEDFVDNNNSWTATEWDNTEMDNAALDAHWALQKVYDYFADEHNRNSYDGSNGKVKCYVHYRQDWDNARWDDGKILIGDGDDDFRI